MPIYEYKCGSCGLRFEELKSIKDASADVMPCRSCGSESRRKVSAFSHTISGGSSNETIDMQVGREANKRWQNYHDNQTKRRGDKQLQSFDLPKTKDGKYMPVMGLGSKKEVADRKEYVGALQEHQKQLSEKGLSQFTEKGAF
jgi:putative FmdB family regulatory protein